MTQDVLAINCRASFLLKKLAMYRMHNLSNANLGVLYVLIVTLLEEVKKLIIVTV